MSDSNLHPVMQGVFAPHMVEASKFTLDTSGAVRMGHYSPTRPWDMTWSDLDPFTQGYVEAMFASMGNQGFDKSLGVTRQARFSDLTPETLAAILKDCGDRQRQLPYFSNLFDQPRECGARFWGHRQDRGCKNFPPLTASLGDDGKVRLTTGAA